MSVVIVGGHDRMVRQYKDICREYGCKAKVFTQMGNGLRGAMGSFHDTDQEPCAAARGS